MNYLICTFGFVCLVLTVNGAADDEHLQLRQRCFGEHGFTEDERSASGSSTFLQYPKIKCYLRCFLEGLNLYKEDGSIDPVLAVDAVDQDIREQVRPLINKCITETASIVDRCDKSFEAIKCLHKAAGEAFQLLGMFEPPKKS